VRPLERDAWIEEGESVERRRIVDECAIEPTVRRAHGPVPNTRTAGRRDDRAGRYRGDVGLDRGREDAKRLRGGRRLRGPDAADNDTDDGTSHWEPIVHNAGRLVNGSLVPLAALDVVRGTQGSALARGFV
jgi:hypothetical protein